MASSSNYTLDSDEEEFGVVSLLMDDDEQDSLASKASTPPLSAILLKDEDKPKRKSKSKRRKKQPEFDEDGNLIERRKTISYSPYMVYAREARAEVVAAYPDLGFSGISKKLGEKWKALPTKEKNYWKKKAQSLSKAKMQELNSESSSLSSLSSPPSASSPASSSIIKSSPIVKNTARKPANKLTQSSTMAINGELDPVSVFTVPLPPQSKPLSDESNQLGANPVDAAAYLKVLGDALSTVGDKLAGQPDNMAVSAPYSLLMDAALCSMGSLMVLTKAHEDLNGASPETLASIMDNCSYIMPGIFS